MDSRALIGILLSLGLGTAGGHAEDCPSRLRTDAPVSARGVESRLAFLEKELAKGRHPTRVWANAWGSTWVALTAIQSVIIAKDEPSRRRDDIVFAAATPLGILPTWIFSPKIAGTEFVTPSTAFPGACEALQRAETLVQAYAEDDAARTGWAAHASSAALNIGLALAVGWGFGHWNYAAWNTAAGIAVGEAQILTYPAAAERLRDRYLEGDFRTTERASWLDRAHWSLVPMKQGALMQASLSWD